MPYADPADRRVFDRERKRRYRAAHPGSGSGRSGRKLSLFDGGRFVAFDGEGLEARAFTPQRYALLSWSDGGAVNGELVRRQGIPTSTALAAMCAVARAVPRIIPVCFGASYDVNMILRDLSREDVTRLWAGERVDWERWRIEYRPRKSLTIHEWADGHPTFERTRAGWRPRYSASFTLWDVFGFFQTSFLDALRKWLTPRELRQIDFGRIVAGKARRSQFTAAELPSIRRYTKAELAGLVLLMERLREHLREADLPIARWDGAGAVAATMLRVHGVKDHMVESLPELERAAQHAYSGGRIEVIRYGTHRAPVWGADLNSAYPAAMLHLPSLRGGTWHAHTPCSESRDGFAMVRMRWLLSMRRRGDPDIFPFFYRDRYGDICYPPDGEGWVWAVEHQVADEALRTGVYRGHIDVRGGWCFHPGEEARPFAFVPEVYERRREWKRAGKGAEKVLKLGTNSLYGKLAQQVGYSVVKEEGGARSKRPPFHNLAWAGYVTARTRATLLGAALRKPSAVVMFATDALYTTSPLDLRPAGEGLGEWTVVRHQGGIVVAQSGIYWLRDQVGELPLLRESEYRRGFDAGSLSSDFVRLTWRMHAREVEAQATRFVTMGSALDGGGDPECREPSCPQEPKPHKLFSHWRTWRTIPRDLRLDPSGTKRVADPQAPWAPDRALVSTLARVVTNPREDHVKTDGTGQVVWSCPLGCVGSWPYPLLWRGQELHRDLIDGVSERIFEIELQESEL